MNKWLLRHCWRSSVNIPHHSSVCNICQKLNQIFTKNCNRANNMKSGQRFCRFVTLNVAIILLTEILGMQLVTELTASYV